MNAAILRLEEEVRVLTDNLAHLNAGGEPDLDAYERRSISARIIAERAEIRAVLVYLRIAFPDDNPLGLTRRERAIIAEAHAA